MLSDFDKIVSRSDTNKRVTIPMTERHIWRSVADMLRDLATTLDHYSRLPATEDLTERTTHILVGSEIDRTNFIIKTVAKQAGIEIREGRAMGSTNRRESEAVSPH